MSLVEVAVIKKVKAPFSPAWIRKIITASLKGAKCRKKAEISVTLAGDAEVRRLNKKYRKKDKTTDVLSFEGGMGDLGDIVISVPQAMRQAKENNKPPRREMAMLLVHGTLHLLEYDHIRPKDAKVMLPLQERILKKLGH